ncbi:SH3 domain-containing protein [bacterium]|nr:SH3 domain-containing protein [bacterium]
MTGAAPSVQADEWGSWQEMRGFYDAGKYQEALDSLNNPQNTPSAIRETAGYLYNLGLITFRLNKTGAAYAYFRKANLLNPDDKDIAYNLKLTRSALERTIGAERLTASLTWSEYLAEEMPLKAVGTGLGLLTLFSSLVLIRTYRGFRRQTNSPKATLARLPLAPSFWGALTAATLSTTCMLIQYWGNVDPPAVAIDSQVVRSGPGDQYLELTQIQAGTPIRLLGLAALDSARKSWVQVRYSKEGGVGWVLQSELIPLRKASLPTAG